MSVKELKLKTAYDVLLVKSSPNGNTIELTSNGARIILDRNQAHLLYLYLKEHLDI